MQQTSFVDYIKHFSQLQYFKIHQITIVNNNREKSLESQLWWSLVCWVNSSWPFTYIELQRTMFNGFETVYSLNNVLTVPIQHKTPTLCIPPTTGAAYHTINNAYKSITLWNDEQLMDTQHLRLLRAAMTDNIVSLWRSQSPNSWRINTPERDKLNCSSWIQSWSHWRPDWR